VSLSREEEKPKEERMAIITMKQLLETGVHFGHQTRRWNPKTKPYIFAAKNGIYIIDLQKTVPLFEKAYHFIRDTVAKGGEILFVGTKKQAQDSIRDEAQRCEMHYVNHRWLGGTLTNFHTIKKSIERLKKLEEMESGETSVIFESLPKKEKLRLRKIRVKLERSLGGIKNMEALPQAVFIVDTKKEYIAVAEARKLHIPVVAILDTNCDPDEVDYPIPGNDDAIRAIRLFCSRIADAVLEGKQIREEMIQAEQDKEIEEPEPPEKSIMEMGNAPDLEETEPAAENKEDEKVSDEIKEGKEETQSVEPEEAGTVEEKA
jgi:small subunit ribosomal protein S2